MKEILVQIAVAAVPLLGSLLVAILGFLAKKSAAWIDAHVHSKELASALERLDFSVANAVAAIEQTSVSALRDKDGKLAPNAAQAAKSAAVAAVKSYLGGEGMQRLAEVLSLAPSEMNEVLGSHIEAAVLNLKRGANAMQTSAQIQQPPASAPG